MRFDILTIFPEFFDSYLRLSLFKKALDQKKITFHLHNIRDYTKDKHRSVDDVPYGGGPGMVFKPEPILRAIEAIPLEKKSRTIVLTPRGELFNQEMASRLAGLNQLILICGRYEGIDERVFKRTKALETSVGDYVLNSGETAVLVLLDTIVRLIPGVLGNRESILDESFSQNLLEYPQYTRPPKFKGLSVPKVLLSGDHKAIEVWRKKMALNLTKERRPDLLKGLKKK